MLSHQAVGQPVTGAQKKKMRKYEKWIAKKRGTPLPPIATGSSRSEPVAGGVSSKKRSDAKPINFPLATHTHGGGGLGFLTSDNPQFQAVLNTSYDGLSVEMPNEIPSEIHAGFRQAMESLEAHGLYHFDITQPFGLGSKCARTFVTRTLVGEPGITYKYLGLRMFAHPWQENETTIYSSLRPLSSSSTIVFRETSSSASSVTTNSLATESEKKRKRKKKQDDKPQPPPTPSSLNNNHQNNNSSDNNNVEDVKKKTILPLPQALVLMGKMNEFLIKRGEIQLTNLDKKRGARSEGHGSCAYNLTLINRMVPESDRELKPEPMFQAHKCSVSWHADSSLQHFSTIAVYHQTSIEPSPSWRLALKVEHDAEGPSASKLKVSSSQKDNSSNNNSNSTPPVCLPLPSGATYYLLDDFNHHHQHAVLAGNSHRFASTHRVSKVESHTLTSILERCTQALEGVSPGFKRWRGQQLALSEVEFEWIRQFYIQGGEHHATHIWWHEPFQRLQTLWTKLEIATQEFWEALEASAGLGGEVKRPKRVRKTMQLVKSLGAECYDILLEALKDRQEKRQGWAAREKDPVFLDNDKPLPCPLFSSVSSPLSYNLSSLINSVTEAKEAFIRSETSNSHSSDNNNGSKETKSSSSGVGSNSTTKDSKTRFNHAFDTEYGDHFETPKRAYEDIQGVLDLINSACHPGKERSALRIYDPYYCQGAAKRHLASLGFTNVVHENRDFYADVKANSVPVHDVLLTNPPFSLDHKEKILGFASKNFSQRGTPFVLLMPNYVATKGYFANLTQSIPTCFYVPELSYEYEHPEGTGHDASPFFSLWFIGGLTNPSKQKGLTLASTVEQLKAQGIVQAKRLNPKQRSQKKKKARVD